MSSLADLTLGQSAVVQTIDGQDAVTARLLEMGLIPGTAIKLLGSAPLGDPLEFQIRGYRLSLRKNEASRVTIQLTTS
jgi:ferrous iron transport protein A